MKKTALAIVLGALTFSTAASANWYAGADLGLSRVKFSEYSDLTKTKVVPSVNVGYSFGDLRLALDYSHYGSFNGAADGESTRAKIYGLGLSAFYDININSDITPYVGARVAQNVFKVENTEANFFDDDTHYKFGFGASVGAHYKLAKNWSLNGALEYNSLGKFEDTKVNQYGAKVGVRYSF